MPLTVSWITFDEVCFGNVGQRAYAAGSRIAEVTSSLRQIKLFSDLAVGELEQLAGRVEPHRVRRGEIIFSRGDPGSLAYAIARGRVRLVLVSGAGREFELASLGAGELFGDLSLFSGLARTATAIAQEDGQLLLLRQADLLQLLRDHVDIALQLLCLIARRAEHANYLLEATAFSEIGDRLAFALVRLIERRGKIVANGITVEPVTQADLARMVGTSRESINRSIAGYEHAGVLRWRKGVLTVERPEALRERLEPEQLDLTLATTRKSSSVM